MIAVKGETLRKVYRHNGEQHHNIYPCPTGCGDMGTSGLADHGLACFLLNENTNILLDRKLMQLGEQHPESLPFDPALRNFHTVDGICPLHFLSSNCFQMGLLENVSMH